MPRVMLVGYTDPKRITELEEAIYDEFDRQGLQGVVRISKDPVSDRTGPQPYIAIASTKEEHYEVLIPFLQTLQEDMEELPLLRRFYDKGNPVD